MLVAALVLFLAAPAAEPPVLPTLSQRTALLTRQDGFIPFYWDAAAGQVLLEVDPAGPEFLYTAGLAGGAGTLTASLDRGQLNDAGLCRFERVGRRVLLRRVQTARGSSGDAESRRAVVESFPSSVLAALPVVAEGDARLLVDATTLLMADPFVARTLQEAEQGRFTHDAARAVPHLPRSGAFPRNTEIEVMLTFVGEQVAPETAAVLPDGRTLTLALHHSFMKLPEPGFTARLADPRIGAITQDFKDYGAPFTEPLQRMVASRWRLEKKDPTAVVSEPVTPIVFHLDRGMPEPERSAIREAALWWNHAFEEAGFRNALVIRDLPEGATLLDARYSGIEWIHRDERSWSIGEFRSDPRTGEILHAVARIDSHRRRTTSRLWRNLQRPGGRADNDPNLDETSFVLQRLAYLSAHEVGHTLGLHHNMAATTFGWGSVMDYLGANIQPKGGALDLSDAFPRDVGAYDRLAIRWMYSPGASAAALDTMVAEALDRGVIYPTPSDARWAEYDWGPDPVEWLRTTAEVRRVVLARFGPAQLAPGEPLVDLRDRFSLAYLYHRFGIQAAQQHVGGRLHLGARAGDGLVPSAMVPAKQQRRALSLLIASLSAESLDVPDAVLAALGPEAQGWPRSYETFASDAGAEFSLATAARALCDLVTRPLVDSRRAARLALQTDAGALTLAETLQALVAGTWGVADDASPRLRMLQRVAQRSVLDSLLDLGARTDVADDVRAAAVEQLVALRDALKTRRSTDAATTAHVRLAQRDITEFLDHPERRVPRPVTPAPPGRPW